MAASSLYRSTPGLARGLKLSPNTNVLLPRCQRLGLATLRSSTLELTPKPPPQKSEKFQLPPEIELPERLRKVDPSLRYTLAETPLPLSLHTYYLTPLRRKPTHGIRVCDLQLRSFSVGNLQFFCDFAMRAAYYLGLPARGPVPLPRIVERWTVPRSNFVHKKSQENFERKTLRRLIQIQDGDLEVVQCWLGYLEKRSYHGIGMKANLYEHEGLGVGKRMDVLADEASKSLEKEWGNFGMRMNAETADKVEELLGSEAFSKAPRDMEEFYREPIEIKRKK